MTGAVFYLITAMVLSQTLQRFAKRDNLTQLEGYFRISFFFAIFLFVGDKVASHTSVFTWLWHIYLFVLLGYCYQNREKDGMQALFQASAPYILTSFITDVLQATSYFFTSGGGRYVEYVSTAAFIWMAASLYSSYRQVKTAEKQRIAKQKEDELNRAIATRKVELEGLVVERTKELLQQKEELQVALNELQATQTQLIQAEKMASLGELTAGIAHEIQNPLNFVNNFSELNAELVEELEEEINKGDLEEIKAIAADIKGNEEKIRFHGKRADAIVKGMLMHSRKSTGQKEPADINALADEYLRLSYHGLRAKDKSFNATMHTNFDASVSNVNMIPQDIGRVLLNLYNNAFYAVSDKKKLNTVGYEPTVTVSTKKVGDKVEIEVKDNGNGIPADIQEKIFQPFFTTKPTGQGTSLGLSLSYDIIKAHGGEIKAESKAGEGTTFIIVLPG